MNFKVPLADPPIKSLQHHAFYLSMLLNDKRMLTYLYNNFIMLKQLVDFDGRIETEPDDYNEYRYIECKGLVFRNSLNFFDADNAFDYIINLHIQKLKDGYCVEGDFDEFYVPYKDTYNKFHFMHNYFLIGVNEEEEYFYSAGYNNSSGGYSKYSEFIISFDDYKEALKIRRESFPEYDHCWRFINYLKPNFDQCNSEIDTNGIREQLYKYLGINSYNLKPYEGINTISHVAEQLNNGTFDLRNFRFIMEHAQLMLDRVRYLDQNGFIKDGEKLITMIKNTADLSEKQFLLAIKYSLTRKESIIQQIQNMLHVLVEKERTSFTVLAEKI